MPEELKDGFYKGDDALYLVKGDKVVMQLITGAGGQYKTSKNFVFGTWKQELTERLKQNIEEVYDKLPSW